MSEQPPPTKNDWPAVWDMVMEDMRSRDAVGLQRYGTRLQPHNGRDALRDAYEEALDLVVYLRQAIAERDDMKHVPALTFEVRAQEDGACHKFVGTCPLFPSMSWCGETAHDAMSGIKRLVSDVLREYIGKP